MDQNFGEAGKELEDCPPPDWKESLSITNCLTSASLKLMVNEIDKLWLTLGKRIKEEVKESDAHRTLELLPHSFVIPGGRFREIYYWDTYWIVRALVLSEMFATTRGILLNFFHQIRQHGMVPNGSRSYYCKRSQPPFLISMVKHYLDNTGDYDLLVDNIDLLVVEMDWWRDNRRVTVNNKHKMFRYDSGSRGPRPKSYLEDVEAAHLSEVHNTEEEKEMLYRNIKAVAESGWDFSARWMIDTEGRVGSGTEQVRILDILPVDLNALMYKNYVNLVDMMKKVGRLEEVDRFNRMADELREAVMEVMFEPETKTWRDFDMLRNKQNPYYFASNLFPLWAGCYPPDMRVELGEAGAAYLEQGDYIWPGGLVTSEFWSGQQWDAPNCWAPLQHLVVAGLIKCGGVNARRVAKKIARHFVTSAMVWCNNETCEFYEKYDGANPTEVASGGEYLVQLGFGWTNGVILDFIQMFGDDALSPWVSARMAKCGEANPSSLTVPGKEIRGSNCSMADTITEAMASLKVLLEYTDKL